MADHVSAILNAAKHADWMQVVLNQGPPCFHIDDDGTFCFRAKRWAGHDSSHKFVSLHDLLVDEQTKKEQAVKAAFAAGKAAGKSSR